MAKSTGAVLTAAKKSLDNPRPFDDLLTKLAAKDKANIERHLAFADADSPHPDHGKLWRRLARALGTLAPHAIQTTGQQAIQFFIADGKYKKQVFALEDPRDGRLMIYSPDAVEVAVKSGVVTAPRSGADALQYGIKGAAGQTLQVEALDNANTPNPAAFYKHMLGWNRKAMRITLTLPATPAQVDAAEALCALAAREWNVEA